MEKKELPANIRTILLAYPTKARRRTKKYVPPVYVPGTVDTGVKPGAIEGEPVENWRLNQLAVPRRKVEKYVFVPEEGVGTGIPPSALTIEIGPRSEDLAQPALWRLVCQKELYKYKGEKFIKNMDNTIERSLKTVYNYYKRQLLKKKKKPKKKKFPKGTKRKDSKGKPIPEKEIMERLKKANTEWCWKNSTPKKVFPPSKLPPRKVANLDAIAGRIRTLAEPRYPRPKYLRPSIDPTWVDPYQVPEPARTLVSPSPRVKELAVSPAHKVRKDVELIPGAVVRAALFYNITPKIKALAEPKKKANETDTDLKENPFAISPFALKCKPTPRILELAKPIER